MRAPGPAVRRSPTGPQPGFRAGRPALPVGAAARLHCGPSAVLLTVALLLGGCQPASQRVSGRVFPLPRQHPDDALAVVTRPGGEGLQIWLDPDTGTPGICRPRWNPDAARLSGGDGATPRAMGRAPRGEFYAAMERGPVRWQLRRQFAAVCRRVAPGRAFRWSEPPRSAEQFRPSPLPLLEERHLLSHPNAIRRAEKRLLGQPLTSEDLNDRELPEAPPGP